MLLLGAGPLEVGRDHEGGVHPAVRVQHAVVDAAAVLFEGRRRYIRGDTKDYIVLR